MLDRNIILNHASPELQNQLKSAGYVIYISPVTEFLKAGGGTKCLTLDLDPRQENLNQGIEKNKMAVAVEP